MEGVTAASGYDSRTTQSDSCYMQPTTGTQTVIGGEEVIVVLLIEEAIVVVVVMVMIEVAFVGVVGKVEIEGLELPVELPKAAAEGLDVVDQKCTMMSVEAAINNNGMQISMPVISDSGCIPRRDFVPG